MPFIHSRGRIGALAGITTAALGVTMVSATGASAINDDVPGTAIYGFEKATDADGADNGFAGVFPVAGDVDGLVASSGCYYAVAEQNLDNDDYIYQLTRFGGYTSDFPEGGWSTGVDFYLDVDVETGGTFNQFDWSVAVNNASGAPRRDFILHAQSAGAGTWTLGASNNTAFEGVDVAPLTGDTLTLDESGWYSVTHDFSDVDGVLSVAISVADHDGVVLKTWTRSTAEDLIGDTVGGNRYGWLTVNGFDALPIDNVRMNEAQPEAGCTPPFEDVNAGTMFSSEIAWMHHAGLANGWTTATGAVYKPLANVNRAVMAAFLYRLAGADEYYDAPDFAYFTDVPTTHRFFKEISWLYDAEITDGWENKDGSLRFQPTTRVNRDMMAAFLYRFVGEPDFDAGEALDFTDVNGSTTFATEIAWLSAAGITNGWTMPDNSVQFRPTSPVKRDQMAAFVYRFATGWAS